MKSKKYIVEINNYEGEDTALTAEILDGDEWLEGTLYAIVSVDKNGAGIVDSGYRSIKEAAKAWPEAVKPSPEHLAHGGSAFAGGS